LISAVLNASGVIARLAGESAAPEQVFVAGYDQAAKKTVSGFAAA
jgi:hypothetical protein